MSNFIIQGGRPLKGSVEVASSKNACLPMMAAALLTTGKTVLKDVPRILEVERYAALLTSIGCQINWLSNNRLSIEVPKKLRVDKMDHQLGGRVRVSLMLIGVLIHRHTKFKIPSPGGCKLGNRTVMPHIFALEDFGVKIKTTKNFFEVSKTKLSAADIVMYESGDTTTENAILAAVLVPGKTTIRFASSNYMVQDLCKFLEKMGAKIKGIGTSKLVITGVKKLKPVTNYSVMPDPIVAMFYITLAATTNSSFTIKSCPLDFIQMELKKLEKMGWKYKIVKRYKSKNKFFDLVDIKSFKSNLKALDDKIHPSVYPGINIDNLPFFVPIATQAKGATMIHDWIYENRAIYYSEMVRLGAQVELADPHRVFIHGKTKLFGTEIMCPPQIRSSAILLIGMLAASGKSVLRNASNLQRGMDYQDLLKNLHGLGANIEWVEN